AMTGRQRATSVIADERTNSVLVTGMPDKISQAKEILKRIDIAQPGQQPVLVGPALLKHYDVNPGSAEAVAKTLQEVYKNSSTVRISAVGTGAVMVYAGPDDQIEISRQLSGAAAVEKNTKTELIPLGSLDATKITDTLKAMYGDVKSGAPYFEADTDRNAVMVRGTPVQILDIQSTVRSLGASGGGLGGNVRVINLEKGSAATLAEALERMIPQMRANPVQMINPLGGDTKPKTPAPAPAAPPAAPSKPVEKPAAQGQPNLQQISFQQNGEPQQPAKPTEASKPGAKQIPGNANAPLKISVFGNRLMLSCDDPETLALAQEMVKVMTQAPSGEGDYEIIRLQNSSAAQVAEILEKAYNGAGQQPGQGGGAGGGFG
ncbi:MAG: secretin N-terminal domain-containing protein, partial [Gemmataceae bacterium]